MTRTLITASVLLGFVGAAATAQVAPPPPPPAEEEPAYEPPAAAPSQPAARPSAAAQPRPNRPATLPNIPHEPLAQKGEDGKVIRITDMTLDQAALRVNPTVSAKRADTFMEVLKGRRTRFENIVIDNVDLIDEINGGIIQTISMNDIENMTMVAEIVKPLVGPTTLTRELEGRKIFTRVQAGLNQRIIREYQAAVSEEFKETNPANSMDIFMQFVLEESVREAMLAYEGLLAESMPNLTFIAETVSMPESAAGELKALAGPTPEDPALLAERVAAIDAALNPLSIEEKQAFLRQVIDMRLDPLDPPIAMVVLETENKRGLGEESKLGIEIEVGGKKVTPKRDQNETDGD